MNSERCRPLPHRLPAEASLFLDLDGTFIEIAARPHEVRVGEELIALLNGLLLALE